MKKIVFSLIAFAIAGSFYAQNINFGVKGGLNVAGYHGKDTGEGDPLYSYHLGAVAEVKLTNKLSIQPELVLSATGAKNKRDFGKGVVLDVSRKINYLSVPVLAKYYVFQGLALELGPQFSYAASRKTNFGEEISGKLKKMGVPEQVVKGIGKKIEFPYNKFDFAAAVGLSYELPVGLFVSARYLYSFTNYPKEMEIPKVGLKQLDIKPQVLQFSLGYKF